MIHFDTLKRQGFVCPLCGYKIKMQGIDPFEVMIKGRLAFYLCHLNGCPLVWRMIEGHPDFLEKAKRLEEILSKPEYQGWDK
jgi:hypothetical protein